jgi:hypothetical protein
MPRKAKEQGDETSIPAAARLVYIAIVALTDTFCRVHRNAEIEAFCRKLGRAVREPLPG